MHALNRLDSVLWSDGTELELFGTVDHQYVWRRKNEAHTGNLQRLEAEIDSRNPLILPTAFE